MFSLSAIPEPSNNAPKPDAAEAVHQPLSAVAVEDQPDAEPVKRPTQKPGPDAEQQVDSVAVLLVLLIAGALLRLVLGLLGPLDPVPGTPPPVSHLLQLGRSSLWPLAASFFTQRASKASEKRVEKQGLSTSVIIPTTQTRGQ